MQQEQSHADPDPHGNGTRRKKHAPPPAGRQRYAATRAAGSRTDVPGTVPDKKTFEKRLESLNPENRTDILLRARLSNVGGQR